MSKTKTINTVAPVKVAGMEVGSILQDKDGYFYRAKGGLTGAHDWRKDNDHRPTIDDVKQDLPPGATIPQVKAPQERKGPGLAPQGQKPQAQDKGGDAKTSQAKPQETPQKPAQAKETPQATQSPQGKPATAQVSPKASPEAAQAGQDKLDPALIHATISGAKPVALDELKRSSNSVAAGMPSQVRYKLVEAQGQTGTQFWLYPGYNRPQGFKWESLGGFMFLDLGAVETFLTLNGITITEEVEKADVRQGSYNPNKGVTPNDDPNGQRNLI